MEDIRVKTENPKLQKLNLVVNKINAYLSFVTLSLSLDKSKYVITLNIDNVQRTLVKIASTKETSIFLNTFLHLLSTMKSHRKYRKNISESIYMPIFHNEDASFYKEEWEDKK